MIWTSGSVGLCKSNNLKIIFYATRCLASKCEDRSIKINDKIYEKDSMSNITPKILSHLNRNLHMQKQHPLSLIKENIVNYMYGRYKPSKSNRGMPLFSVHEDVSPIVTMEQNFDSLLVPRDHVSRAKSDSYYVNKDYMLRAHTSAHQSDLIKMGLDNFLVVGDVYRQRGERISSKLFGP